MRPLVLATLLVASLISAPGSAMADHAGGIFADFPELSEFGYFVIIDGDEYWAPHAFRCEDGWAPYARGYLYEDPADGLVWVSYDPWGFITEHYGYWRHHQQYGYVWRPLYPLQWRPYVASILHDRRGAIIGWTPFYAEVWDHGYYRFGFGFDDCFWAPYWSRVHYGDFYYHHYDRFSGWYVGVTLYDYDVYYRTVPEHCYRRDWEYRERHHRNRNDARSPAYKFRDRRESKRAEQTTVRRREDAPVSTGQLRGDVSIPARSVEIVRQTQENRQRTISEKFEASRVKLSEVQRPAATRESAPALRAVQPPQLERELDVVQPQQAARERSTEPAAQAPSQATVEPRRGAMGVRQPRAESRQAPEVREAQPAHRAVEVRESQPSRRAAEVRESQPAHRAAEVRESQPARRAAEVRESQPTRREAEVREAQPSRPAREVQATQPSRQADRAESARSRQVEASQSRPSNPPAERVKAGFESRSKDKKGRN